MYYAVFETITGMTMCIEFSSEEQRDQEILQHKKQYNLEARAITSEETKQFLRVFSGETVVNDFY